MFCIYDILIWDSHISKTQKIFKINKVSKFLIAPLKLPEVSEFLTPLKTPERSQISDTPKHSREVLEFLIPLKLKLR